MAIATAAGTGTGTGTAARTTVSTSPSGNLAKRLDAEQKTREASERLLRAELDSREDMEALFVSLRDVALRPNDNAAAIASREEGGRAATRGGWRGGDDGGGGGDGDGDERPNLALEKEEERVLLATRGDGYTSVWFQSRMRFIARDAFGAIVRSD